MLQSLRVSRDEPEQAEEIGSSFAQTTMTMVRTNNVDDDLLMNVDETGINFHRHSNYTVCEKGAKTISVRHSCSVNKRCTVCIAAAADGTKLPLLGIFNTAENGPVVCSLHSIMPPGM